MFQRDGVDTGEQIVHFAAVEAEHFDIAQHGGQLVRRFERLRGIHAFHVGFRGGQLFGADAVFIEALQDVERHIHRFLRCLRTRIGADGDGAGPAVQIQHGTRPVGKAAVDAEGIVEKGGEASAEERVEKLQSGAFRVGAADTGLRDFEVGLRRVGFIDEQQASAGHRRGIFRPGVRGAGGDFGEGLAQRCARGGGVEIARHDHHHVAAHIEALRIVGDALAGDAGQRGFFSGMPVGMRGSVEEGPEILADGGLRIVLRGARAIHIARDRLLHFAFGEDRVEHRIGRQVESGREIFAEEFTADDGVLLVGARREGSAQAIEFGGELAGRAPRRAAAQQLRGDRRKASQSAGVRLHAAFHQNAEVHEGDAGLRHQVNHRAVRQHLAGVLWQPDFRRRRGCQRQKDCKKFRHRLHFASGIRVATVRFFASKYFAATRRTSAAVTASMSLSLVNSLL